MANTAALAIMPILGTRNPLKSISSFMGSSTAEKIRYQRGYISEPNFEFIFTTIFQLSFTIVVIAYLALYKKYSIKESIRSLGMSRDKLSRSMFGIGILLFVIIFALEV